MGGIIFQDFAAPIGQHDAFDLQTGRPERPVLAEHSHYAWAMRQSCHHPKSRTLVAGSIISLRWSVILIRHVKPPSFICLILEE